MEPINAPFLDFLLIAGSIGALGFIVYCLNALADEDDYWDDENEDDFTDLN